MPNDRLASVPELINKVQVAIDRVENGGRVLDFNRPKRCLFCAVGTYELTQNIPFYTRAERKSQPLKGGEPWAFQGLQTAVKGQFGVSLETSGASAPIPIFLVCDVCGNVQYFRFDLTSDRSGQKWNP
jgi:hypothetical protein